MSTTRRTLITGAAAAVPAAAIAAVPALALPADDPAFAVIEAYRRAWTGLDAPQDAQDELERSGIAEDDPQWIEAMRAVDTAHDAVSEAEDQFVLTRPTTIAGAAAVLRFISDRSAEGDDLWRSTRCFENGDGDTFDFVAAFLLTLADSLESIAAGGPIKTGRLRRCEEADEEESEPEVVAKEPEPWTPEETIAAHRRVLDPCTAKIAELEAQIASGAPAVA